MTTKVNILVLSGMGDTYIYLVNDEIYNWIISDDPGCDQEGALPSSWIDCTTPQSILDHPDTTEIRLTIGSWLNDRALYCPLNMFREEITLNSHFTLDMAHIVDQIRAAGYEIGYTYEGCLY